MASTQWTRRQTLGAAASAIGAAATFPSRAEDKPSSTPASRGRNGKEILIGQTVQLSGPLAVTMVPVIKGQTMALDECNRKGGIRGRPVRLIALDDAYELKRSIENVNTLLDKEKVIALFGLATTANVLATLPILSEKKVPLIGVYTGSPALRAKQHPYFFTTMASYRDEVVQMIRNLVTVQKTQLALIYQNAPFGLLMKPIVEEVAKELGATLVVQHPLEPNGSNADAAVQALAAAKPQAALFMAFGPAMIPFVKGLRSQVGVPLYCVSISNSQPILDALGDEARGLAFTQLIPYPYRQTNALTRDFAAAAARANVPADYGAFFGYLNVRVLLEGLHRAGPRITSDSIVKGMESIGKFDMGGAYPLNYGPDKHHGSNFVEITIVGPRGRWIR